MFNNKKKEDKMSEQKSVWLVIERYTYTNSSSSHSVKKQANTLEEAIEYKIALEKLNEQKDCSYFLASDVDTIMNNVISAHNKSIANGTYYERHPEVKRPDEKKSEVIDNDITF